MDNGFQSAICIQCVSQGRLTLKRQEDDPTIRFQYRATTFSGEHGVSLIESDEQNADHVTAEMTINTPARLDRFRRITW
jgi:hypothetical protein